MHSLLVLESNSRAIHFSKMKNGEESNMEKIKLTFSCQKKTLRNLITLHAWYYHKIKAYNK